MSKSSKIIILGAPASGKGTVARRLSQDISAPHISTGDILRNTSDPSVQSLISSGKLVDDDTIFRLIKKEIEKPAFILDGFPRTLSQAHKLGNGIDIAIFLDVSDDTCAKRAAGRNEGRADDTYDVIYERLRTYNEITKPVIDFYEEMGKLMRINGEKSMDEVYNDTKKIVMGEE